MHGHICPVEKGLLIEKYVREREAQYCTLKSQALLRLSSVDDVSVESCTTCV